MLFLQKNNIIDLYCWVDSIFPEIPISSGRPTLLSDSELITMLIWNLITVKSKTIKGIYDQMHLYHHEDFKQIPSYKTFVRHSHGVLPKLQSILNILLEDTASTRTLDSTMLPVCKIQRADDHKVAKNIAQFGKNWQGWHYGFKLHASIDLQNKLCGIVFTSANLHDIHGMQYILNEHCDIAVGDTLYGARVMGRKMFEMFGTTIIAPPHPTQKKKIATLDQIKLLNQRSKIESVFDILKEHLHLVSSFPRSVMGYFVHYFRVLIGYQITALNGGI